MEDANFVRSDASLLSVRFSHKPGYKSAEIATFRLERIFQPMRALEFITGHVVYNPAYN